MCKVIELIATTTAPAMTSECLVFGIIQALLKDFWSLPERGKIAIPDHKIYLAKGNPR